MKKKGNLKVLIIHNIIAPYRLPLFEKLNEKVDLTVFFCKENKRERKWSPNLSKYSFKYKILEGFSFGSFFIPCSLPFSLLSERYDVFFVGLNNLTFFAAFLTSFFSEILGKPFIIWSETIETKWFRRHNPFKPLEILYDRADAFVVHSEMTKKLLTMRGVPPEKVFSGVYVMPRELLPKPRIKKAETKYQSKKVILALAYLQKRKGIEYLIKAFKKADLGDVELIIAGSGPEEKRLKSLAADHEHIHFPGYVEGIDKANYYSLADVFVLPTLHDPWGLVINEALYYHTPVITTEGAGGKALISEGENGLVIPLKNVKKLKEALQYTLKEKNLGRMKGNTIRYPNGTEINRGIKPFLKAFKETIK